MILSVAGVGDARFTVSAWRLLMVGITAPRPQRGTRDQGEEEEGEGDLLDNRQNQTS